MFSIFVKIAVAAVGYTFGTLGIKQKGMNPFNAALFTTAFICDVWATYDMYALHPISFSPHSVIGALALGFAAAMQSTVFIGMRFQTHKQKAETFFKAVGLWFLLVWYTAVFLGVIVAAGLRSAQSIGAAV